MSLNNACSEFEPEDCRSISGLEPDRPVTVPADIVQHNPIVQSRTHCGLSMHTLQLWTAREAEADGAILGVEAVAVTRCVL